MSAIADVVDVSITANTVFPSEESFDVGLGAAYHTKYTDRVRSYGSLLDMVSDGFSSADPAYRLAAAFFSQNPHPAVFKLGRRASPSVKTIEITPIQVSTGTVYSGKVNGLAWTYTQGGTQTVAAACTGISAAIDALAGISATVHTSTTVRVTLDATGAIYPFVFDQDVVIMKVGDITADPGLSADLDAIALADPDWYALGLDSESPAEVLVASTWIEAQKKIFGHTVADSDAFDAAVTSDAPSTMKAAAKTRTFGLFNGMTPNATQTFDTYAGMAWIGERLVADPGSDTWAFKTLGGIVADKLTSTQQSALEGKNVNTYQAYGGKNVTRKGIVYSGQYIDVIRGIDWLQSRIASRVFGVIATNEKIPFTDAGINLIVAEIRAQMNLAVQVGFLVPGTVVVTAPKASAISSADKAARLLSGVQFSAELAGAIHKTVIRGNLTI